MRIARLYTGSDGESHIEPLEIPLHDGGPIGRLSVPIPATGIIFRENDPDYHYDWHTAPQRQFIIMLEGEVEIELSDGSRHHFGPGDILLAEDTTGRGHISRALHNQPRRSIFVTLE